MTRPAPRHQKPQIRRSLKRQLWLLFIIIIMAAMLDVMLLKTGWQMARGVIAGAGLAYLSQLVFALMAYRQTSARASRTIMHNMYLGQALKWLVVIAGFALIFIKLQPINAPAVIGGYIFMQLIIAITYVGLGVRQ